MRKRLLLLLIPVAAAAALLVAPYVNYKRTVGIVPPWVRLGGAVVEGATADDIAASLEWGIREPIAAYYGNQRLLLRPEEVGFRVDVAEMLAEARELDSPGRLARYLIEQSLGRTITATDVPLRFQVDGDALAAWLADVAQQHDRAPGAPQPLVEELTLAPGRPGAALDVAASRERVLDALASPADRTIDLAVTETPPLPLDLSALEALLRARLVEFPGIAGVYLHHLPTGEELAVEADVAYAGTSTLKIPILAQLYRKLDDRPDLDTTKIISETMMLSGNFTANLMLGIIGDGDWDEGVRRMNQTFRELGMENTFMASPYDRKLAVTPHILTPANSRTDLNTEPDPYMQTTPRDIGMSLQMIVACSEGGGALIAAYESEITPSECQQALDAMALNEMHELLVGGLPEGARAVHKHGYVSDTHGDVAAIWGAGGPYVLAVFLYRPTWLEWDISNPTMQDLAAATWNYFELVAQARDGGAGAPPPDAAVPPLSD